MSEERPGTERDQGADVTRPFAPLNPRTRPQQQTPQQQTPQPQPQPFQMPPPSQAPKESAPQQWQQVPQQSGPWTQRREHPGPPPGQGQSWGSYPQGAYPQPPPRTGSGGAFVAALIASLVAVGVSVGSGYAAAHAKWASTVALDHLYSAGLAIWPRSAGLSDSSDPAQTVLKFGTPSYLAAFAVAGLVLLLLLWAAIKSTPGGRGVFSTFLAAWGATLVAGAIGKTVEVLIASNDYPVSRVINSAFYAGGLWAVHVGWIVGLVAAIGQAARKRS